MDTFNEVWVDEIIVNDCAVFELAAEYSKNQEKAWKVLEPVMLLKAIAITDLTTLAGNDTISNVTRLVNKAARPLRIDMLNEVITSIVNLIRLIYSIDLANSIFPYDNSEIIRLSTTYRLCHEDLVGLKSLLTLLGFKYNNEYQDLRSFLIKESNSSGMTDFSVAAICVYPKMVKLVANVQHERQELEHNSAMKNGLTKATKKNPIPIATVAAGFPSGQYDIESKIKEINFAVQSGANEIDIVISRCLVIGERWKELFDEIFALKRASGHATLKTILAVGECGSLQNVYKASMVAMMAGSDYIKTSTGKESVNATLPVGIVMCRAIRNFYLKTGKKIGFKPAGGIKSADDALRWLNLIVTELGVEWLSLFRIGASSMLDNIEQRLQVLFNLQ